MKTSFIFFIEKKWTLLLLFAFLCLGCSPPKETLVIAAASNLKFVLEDLIEKFTKENPLHCELVLSSSGKLTAQIQAGAPFDIFIAADENYTRFLAKKNLTYEPPQTIAFGKLVLWSMNTPVSLKSLTQAKQLAIANPKLAPFGTAAVETMVNLSVYDSLTTRIVYGQNISQINVFITSEAVELGFSSLSSVLPQVPQGYWLEVPPNLYTKIEQSVVRIRRKGNSKRSQFFYDFLFSTEVREIFRNHGYSVSE